MNDSLLRYRPNVAAILRRADGKILVCERSDVKGAWQFPQGGVDPGETAVETLYRELEEEISVPPALYTVAAEKGPYRYRHGDGRTKRGFHGQEQQYFLVDFHGVDADIDLEVEHREFSRFRWIAPEAFDLAWLPEWKRDVYEAVMQDFFQVSAKSADLC